MAAAHGQTNGALGPKVVGLGSLGMDYLAQVAKFPKPDEKLRTESLEPQGGGNCANALTGAARLGLRPTLITKIGDDNLGDALIKELEADGVDSTHVLRAPGAPSPFTYIIVDRDSNTRTCIHTPGVPLQPHDVTQQVVATALDGAAAVFLDGRLAEAALVLARAAKQRGIPILVEAEREREGLWDLLRLASFVTCSATFPLLASEHTTGNVGDALVDMLSRLPDAEWIMSTQGSKGSVMLARHSASGTQTVSGGRKVQDVLSDLWARLDGTHRSGSGPGCRTSSGHLIRAGAVVDEIGLFIGGSGEGVACRLAAAAPSSLGRDGIPIADTTGAGDAFNAALLYGIATGLSPTSMMVLGNVTAGSNCTVVGARAGMPPRDRVDNALLMHLELSASR